MWTLLSVKGVPSRDDLGSTVEEVDRATSLNAVETGVPRADAGVDARASEAVSNGTHLGVAALRPVENGRELSVAVYLHPGRARVATMAAGQAAEQFDLVRAREYPSLGAAELACDDCPGFLLEISEPFLDDRGQRRAPTILFVPGLGR